MFEAKNKSEKLFRLISYGVALTALLTLLASGSIGVFNTFFFLIILLLAWIIEDSRWQISERVGVALIVLVVPFFYLDWKYQLSGFNSRDAFAAGNLSRIILILASIKLLQKKGDRDWVLIYLISFFEILLAAGVGISPLFLACLLIYLLFSFSAIILFEIRKTSSSILEKKEKQTLKLKSRGLQNSQLLRLPLTAFILLLLISFIAIPLFFVFPRVGGAGFGSNLNGITSLTEFSDSVRLGEIGRLQQSDQTVMRIKVEKPDGKEVRNLRWRGVALDSFNNQTWFKSRPQYADVISKGEQDYFALGYTQDVNRLVTQTVYLEPIETPILFALASPVALQGNFQLINKDLEGSLSSPRANAGRISYKVISDNVLPSESELRKDDSSYTPQFNRYLQLPENLDERIKQLTGEIIQKAGAKGKFEQAKAVESYLKNNYGYSLEMKAGGKDPLADFIFNVREGHCEYFASALAIMLRTQGIATRVVNGFQSGEYNDTADVFVVKQKDAHSWVEVYFPKEKVWVPFDATPAGGQFAQGTSSGITSSISKFLETLETYWIQYVVSYDNLGQRSLLISLRNILLGLKATISIWAESAQISFGKWWEQVRGENGVSGSIIAILWGIGYLLIFICGILSLIWSFRKLLRLKLWERIRTVFRRKRETSVVEFYQRMQKILAKRGLMREPHQTPLEFAFALNMPQAVSITEKYHDVRFGEKKLSKDEAQEIENWLIDLEKNEQN